MSFDDLKHVHAMNYVWKDPLHFCVMAEIAKRYNPTFGYAWPALTTIAERYSRSERRVNEVTVELEHVGLVIRLGPDPDALGTRKGTQRFVPIWRVENGVQQQLREAIEADEAATRGEQPGDHAVATGATHRRGACDPSQGGPATHRRGGLRPIAGDQGTFSGTSEVPRSTETAAAAAQLRLPTLLAEIRRTLVEEILRKRHAFHGTDPAADGNFRAICKVVGDVVASPALGARLLKGYEAERDSDVIEAARRLCDGRHIDWGKPRHDKLEGALQWVRAKEQILRERSGS